MFEAFNSAAGCGSGKGTACNCESEHETEYTLRVPMRADIIAKTLESPLGERAYKIVEKLSDAGFDAWWVGGGVRDMLQGQLPADIDIATSALPEEALKLFKRSKAEAAALGSIRVTLGDDTFEITTFREDDEASDGRHPEAVVFTRKKEDDAARRDFTVNAIYWNPISRGLFDPYAGEGDVKERLIRFIGEPAIRIKHDALRILRAVRFRAVIDGQYHPETYRALQEQAAMIDVLSGERLRTELEKMLLCRHPDRALEDLLDLQILNRFLPELSDCKGIPQPADYHHEGDVWEHTLQCVKSFRPEDGIDVRIAALFHDCGKAKTFSLKERIRFDHHATVSAELAEDALTRLQCPGDRKRKIDWLIRHHMSMTFLQMPEERKAHWYFHPWFAQLLQLFYLDIAGTDPADYSLYDGIIKDYNAFLDAHPRPAKPLLTGHDVMEILGLKQGEEVGKVMKALNEAQVRKEVTSKAEAREFVKKLK